MKKLILLGYMGSGKTTVARQLSDKLGISYHDLDDEISKIEGISIPEIFKLKGEIYFRKKENEILKYFLNSDNENILALGGGTICYGNNLELLKNEPSAILFYLKTSLPELTQRLFREREERPLIAHLDTKDLLEDFIRKHLFERNFYYNQSDFIVETDQKPVDQVAEEILKKL